MIVRIILVLLALSQPVQACEVPERLAEFRAELLALTNRDRATAGLSVLTRSAALEAAAQTQACRTSRRERLSHRGSWFAGLGRRLRREAYRYGMAAENLAEGQRSAAEVHEDWLNSPEHRVNTMDARPTDVGFGVARAENGRLHWSMVLAAPRTE